MRLGSEEMHHKHYQHDLKVPTPGRPQGKLLRNHLSLAKAA